MKANSRKRVLISSVAMLLVALVALSTATFAWFTNATQAKANGLTLTANAAKGLQVTTDGEKWGTNQTWVKPEGYNQTISPLSIPFTVGETMPAAGFYASKAGVDGAYVANNGYEYEFKAFTIPSALDSFVNDDTYLLSYKVGAKISGLEANDTTTKAALTATINAKAADLGSVVRIAIVDSTTKTVYGVYGDSAIKAINSVDPSIANTDSVANTNPIACGEVSGTPRYFNVYMWIEGQDAECVDEVMNKTGEYFINFSIPENFAG